MRTTTMARPGRAVTTLVCAGLAAALALGGASVSIATESAQDETAVTEGLSLTQVHEALGTTLPAVDGEMTYADCSPCHGDYTEIRAKTLDMWPGIGQITDANPHDAHATNAFECSDCHQVDEPQVNVCNQCHNFESPEGWVDMDPTTTIYGANGTSPHVYVVAAHE